MLPTDQEATTKIGQHLPWLESHRELCVNNIECSFVLQDAPPPDFVYLDCG